jgi:hypothetical protein
MRSHSAQDSGTDGGVPIPGVIPVDRMTGEGDEDTALLREMFADAKNYVLSFSWRGSIVNSYFAGGVGKIFAIFLFNISPAQPDVDRWMWIVVGDVPPAYLPLEDCKSAAEVFETYIAGTKRWVNLAREGMEPTSNDSVPPINVPATPEWAEQLDRRLRMLDESVKPFFQ